MATDDARERFEAWAAKQGFSVRAEEAKDNIYWNPSTQQLWEAWQAAVRDTRERCAEIAEEMAKEPVGWEWDAALLLKRVAERIRQGDSK